MPTPNVWLVGEVIWADPKAEQLNAAYVELEARVNGSRQFPVALDRRGMGDAKNVRRFRVPMTLTKDQNVIKVELPAPKGQADRPQVVDSLRLFEVACAKPAKSVRFHLLIVGVDVNDGAVLKQRVMDAIFAEEQGRPQGSQGPFTQKNKELFATCILYHVLVGEVERGKVEAQLLEMNKVIKRMSDDPKQQGVNDVIMVYYQGQDVRDPNGRRWLLTSRNLLWPKVDPGEWAIPCHDLPRLPGVQLLILNVAGAADPKVNGRDWGGDPNTNYFRYACNDPDEPKKPNPELLALMQSILQKDGTLGRLAEQLQTLKKNAVQAYLDPSVRDLPLTEGGK